MSQKESQSWWIMYTFFWLDKSKQTAINPINKKDNKCFQYTVTVALNHEEIKGLHKK